MMQFRDAFEYIASRQSDDLIVTSAGYASRAWRDITGDYDRVFYLEASMSLSSMFAAGIAQGLPEARVWAFMGDGAFAMPARLFVTQHRGAEARGVEIVAGRVLLLLRCQLEDARRQAGEDDLALRVAPVRIETVADDRSAAPHHIGDDGHRAHRHLAEIDDGIAHRGAHGDALVANLGDAHAGDLRHFDAVFGAERVDGALACLRFIDRDQFEFVGLVGARLAELPEGA